MFNIQQAFTRRERALSLIANLKASAVGLYFQHRDWAQVSNSNGSFNSCSCSARSHAVSTTCAFLSRWLQDEGILATLGNDHTAAALHCKLLLVDLLRDVRSYLIADSPYESYAEARLSAKHNTYANMIMADLSLSGASQLSFQAAVESAQKADPATAALRRCYR